MIKEYLEEGIMEGERSGDHVEANVLLLAGTEEARAAQGKLDIAAPASGLRSLEEI